MRWWFGRKLTFEIEADETEPSVAAILSDASGGLISGSSSESVLGYAAYGRDQRSAVQPLIEQFAIPLHDDGDRIGIADATIGVSVPDDQLGCGAGADAQPRIERTQAPVRTLPRVLNLSYYDPARDHQLGQMRASAASTGGVEESVELAATMTADRAKALAESSIARRWAQRDRLVLRVPPEWIELAPGDLLRMADAAVWRVDRATIEELVVRVELSPVWGRVGSAAADSGAHLPAPDVVAAPTTVALFDLPDLGTGRRDVPVLAVAACQAGAGWRLVPLEVAIGGEIQSLMTARSEAVLGHAVSVLASGQSALLDLLNSVEIELAGAEHWLESRDEDALANGANLAVLGKELIQFGSAVPMGSGRFRLSKLLRGRRGTEWAMNSHAAGERFALINPGALQSIELPLEALGSEVRVKAMGLADVDAVPVSQTASGEALRSPSPVHLSAAKTSSGDLLVRWVRRSRTGWAWLDGIDAPLGEGVERYRVQVESSGGSLSVETNTPIATISAAQLSSLGVGAATISVTQLGDYAESRPASIQITLA